MPDIDRMLSDAADAGRDRARPLPPTDVRGVGNRIRRTRTGLTASFSALAVAGVVGVVLTTSGTGGGPPDIAGPSDAAEVQAQLLSAADVTDLYSPGGALDLLEPEPADVVCEPIGSTPTVAARTSYAWTTSGTGERVVLAQGVERIDLTDRAVSRYAEVADSFMSCAGDPGAASSGSWTVSGIGDEAAVVATFYREQADRPGSVHLAYSARSADVVTWVTLLSVSPEFSGEPDVRVLAAAVDKLCAWSGGPCASDDSTLTPSSPVGEGPDAMLITESDLTTALGGEWSLTQGVEPDPAAPAVVCLPGFVDAGAAEMSVVGFADEVAAEGLMYGVTEYAAEFPDDEAAAAYLDALRAAMSPCGDAGVPFLPIEGVDDAWLLDFDGSDTAYGFRQVGDRVLMVEQTTTTVDPGMFFHLLDLASERAAG